MPTTILSASKKSPRAYLEYILGKPECISVKYRHLSPYISVVDQFYINHLAHKKALSNSSRQYYKLIISCHPNDPISINNVMQLTELVLEQFFSSHSSVTAGHDKDNKHTHSIIDSTNYFTGEMIHMNLTKIQELKDYINELGMEFDMTPVDYRKQNPDRITSREHMLSKNGQKSWKSELREIISNSLDKTLRKNGTYIDFMCTCLNNGVVFNEEGKWFWKSKEKLVGYSRLGALYNPVFLFNIITENHLKSSFYNFQNLEKASSKKIPLAHRIAAAENRQKCQFSNLTPTDQHYVLKEMYDMSSRRFWNGCVDSLYREKQPSDFSANDIKNIAIVAIALIAQLLILISLLFDNEELKKQQQKVNSLHILRKKLFNLPYTIKKSHMTHLDTLSLLEQFLDELDQYQYDIEACWDRKCQKNIKNNDLIYLDNHMI